MSLRFRLNLLVAILLLIGMLVAGWVVIDQERSSIRESVEVSTRVTVQLLETVIISSHLTPELGPTHLVLRDFLLSSGYIRGTTIKLYDYRNELIYQSPPSKYRTDVHPPDWFAAMVVPKIETAERRFRFGRLEVISNAAGTIREAWSNFHVLIWLGLAFFALVNGMVYWTLGWALRPVGTILGAINRMEQGDLSARLQPLHLPEFNRIAQNLNRMAASLEASTEENRRLAMIVRQTGDAIMIHDLEGNISFWNPAAERLFGYSSEEIIGKSAALLAPQDREGELRQNLETIARMQFIEEHETQRLARDGRVLEVSLAAAPLVDPHDNRVVGEICSMRDITERRHAEAAERQLEENRQLTHLIQRHIEEERRNLARELHDELGQYVTAIKTFAVAISNKAREKMPDIESNAQTIAAAANHIYDGMHNIIRQLRPGALDNLGLQETLRDAVAEWQGQNPGLRFTLNFSGDLERLGEALDINLYRIVQEAVTNAVRYSEATRLDVALARLDNGDLCLTVQDNGIGMNLCNVDQTKHFGLLGMRERVQAMRGQFELDSLIGQGTCIRVTVPTREKK